MAQVNLAAADEVFDLLDTDFVENHIADHDVYITFSCVDSEGWQDDSWVGEDGKPSYIIKMPYEQVRRMKKEKVRELMLQKAKERLQQVA